MRHLRHLRREGLVALRHPRRLPHPGINPAYAGSTRSWPLRWPGAWKNARVSGEHLTFGLTRGTGYAGSTWSTRAPSSSRSDHPRVRGEHHLSVVATLGVGESPPRTRGARDGRRQGLAAPRMTPASAGSTLCLSRAGPSCPDHPRVRGEHEPAGHAIDVPTGSPPRTRGARAIRELDLLLAGITPAYAGSAERRW